MNILLTALLMTSPAPAQPRAALPEALQMIERLVPARAVGVEIGRPAARTPLEARLRLALEDGTAPECAKGRRPIKTGEPDEPYRCLRWDRRSTLAGDEDELVGQRLVVAARDPR